MIGTAFTSRERIDHVIEIEIERLVGAVEAHEGPIHRDELARRVNARTWGPGRFRAALREAETEERLHRVGRALYTVAD